MGHQRPAATGDCGSVPQSSAGTHPIDTEMRGFCLPESGGRKSPLALILEQMQAAERGCWPLSVLIPRGGDNLFSSSFLTPGRCRAELLGLKTVSFEGGEHEAMQGPLVYTPGGLAEPQGPSVR